MYGGTGIVKPVRLVHVSNTLIKTIFSVELNSFT